ncbi:MAG: MinD/ParA family protein [Roseburia sp.]|nr:MinD/ParA family protein [Roseburia sp.]
MDQAQQLRNVIKKQNQKVVQHTARVITVTSGKGGVGKSNLSVNLAIQFRKMGKKVLIVDADFGLANVEVMFGAIPKHNLSDLIYHGKDISEIITEGPMEIGFISGGSGILALNNLTKDQIMYLVKCLEKLSTMTDVLIVDTGAGITDSVLEFVLASPEVLLVSTPDPSSLTDSYSLLKALHHHPDFSKNQPQVYVVANRVSSEVEGRQLFEKLDSVVRQFLAGKIQYLGAIPQDSALEKAVRQQKPVSLSNPSSKSAEAFENIANAIMNGGNAVVSKKWGITKLINKIINR